MSAVHGGLIGFLVGAVFASLFWVLEGTARKKRKGGQLIKLPPPKNPR